MNDSDSENSPVGANVQPRKSVGGRRSIEEIAADYRRILSPSSVLNVTKSPQIDVAKAASPAVLNVVPLKEEEPTKMDSSSDDEYKSADEDLDEAEETTNISKSTEHSFATCRTRISNSSVATSAFKDCTNDSQLLSPDCSHNSDAETTIVSDSKTIEQDDVPHDYAEFGLKPEDQQAIRKLIVRKSVEHVQAYTSLSDIDLEEVPLTIGGDSSIDDLLGAFDGLKLESKAIEAGCLQVVANIKEAELECKEDELDQTLVLDKGIDVVNKAPLLSSSSTLIEEENPLDTTFDRADSELDKGFVGVDEVDAAQSPVEEEADEEVKPADQTFDAVNVNIGTGSSSKSPSKPESVVEEAQVNTSDEVPTGVNRISLKPEDITEKSSEAVPEDRPGDKTFDAGQEQAEEIPPVLEEEIPVEPSRSSLEPAAEPSEIDETKPADQTFDAVAEGLENPLEEVSENTNDEVPSERTDELEIVPGDSVKVQDVEENVETAEKAFEDSVEEFKPADQTFDALPEKIASLTFDEIQAGPSRSSVEPETVAVPELTSEAPEEQKEDSLGSQNSFDEIPVGPRNSVKLEEESEEKEREKPVDRTFEVAEEVAEEKAPSEVVDVPREAPKSFDDEEVGRPSVQPEEYPPEVHEPASSEEKPYDFSTPAPSGEPQHFDDIPVGSRSVKPEYSEEPVVEAKPTEEGSNLNITCDVADAEDQIDFETLAEQLVYGDEPYPSSTTPFDDKNKTFNAPEPEEDEVVKPEESKEEEGQGDLVIVAADISNSAFDDIPVPPKAAYNLDFLDDPSFNPFVPVTEQKPAAKVEEKPASPVKEVQFEEDDSEKENVVPNICANFQAVGELPTANVPVKSVEVQETEVPEEKSVQNETPVVEGSNTEENQPAEEVEDQSMQEPAEPTEEEVNASGNVAEVPETEEIPLKKGGYNLDFLDDPEFNPFEPVAVQKPEATSQMTSSGEPDDVDDIPIKPKSTGGGYNLDFLDDPNFNPFGVPPKGPSASPAPTVSHVSETRGTTDSGVFDELCGSGPPSSSVGVANGLMSDDGSASGGGSLTGSPQHVISEAPDFEVEDQAEIAAQLNCEFKEASSFFMNDPNFLTELEALPVANRTKVLSRMSLFREFDPLVSDEVVPAPTRRESYRRFFRESLGGGDLLSIDNTFSNRSNDKPGKPEPRKSTAPFRTQQVLSPKPEVDNENDDDEAEESYDYPEGDGSGSICSSTTLGETVIENRRGKTSLGASSSFSLRKSAGSKLSKHEKQELLDDMERISKEKEEVTVALEKANATCDKLANSVKEANAARDEAMAALEEERAGRLRAKAEADELRARLDAAKAELANEREEKVAANERIDSLQADLETTKKSLAEARIEARKLQASQSQFREVIKEYEKTMGELLRDKEVGGGASAEELNKLRAERDRLRDDLRTVTADLKSTETAFNSIHSKSERLRETVRIYESNEKKLKAALEEARLAAIESETLSRTMIEAAQEKLEWAKTEVNEANKARDRETAALKGQLRLCQTELSGAQATISQKEKEAKELSKIVEELLETIGASGRNT